MYEAWKKGGRERNDMGLRRRYGNAQRESDLLSARKQLNGGGRRGALGRKELEASAWRWVRSIERMDGRSA